MSGDDLQAGRQDERLEYAKFAVLLLVLLVTLAMVALLSPFFFGQVVPSVLGLTAASELEEASQSEPAPAAIQDGLPPPTAVVFTHTVKQGETLYRISVAYGISVEAIAAANHIVSPQQLEAGTVLIIPQPD